MVWKSGVSGNAGGQRKTKPFYDALRLQIAAAGDDQRALRRVAEALLAKAETGDVAAINALADRLDGKVPQATGGSDELRPHRLVVSWKNDGESEPVEVESASESLAAIVAPDAEDDEG